MLCPRDGNRLLLDDLRATPVHNCNDCSGLWMRLANLPVSDKALIALLDVSETSALCCPADGAVMKGLVTRELTLAACPSCLGVWLDGDEQERLFSRFGAHTPTRPTTAADVVGDAALDVLVTAVIFNLFS